MAAAAVGTFIEIYDILSYGYFASIIADQFFPREDPGAAWLATFAIFALGFAVRPIGAVIFGHIGDRAGRRTALVSSLLLMSAATTAFGLLPTYETVGILAPVLLLLCRVMQGLSASGETTGANVLVLEHGAPARRGRAVALINAAGNVGAGTAATVGFVLARYLQSQQLEAWGWRLAFLAATPIGLVGLYVRLRTFDSPAFLAASRNLERARIREAPIVRALRTAKRPMLIMIAWTAAASLGGYILVGFLPSYLIRIAHLSPADAFAANGLSVAVLALSTLAGGYLVDRYPLRGVTMTLAVGVMITAWPAFVLMTRSSSVGSALLGQSLLAAFLGASGLLGAALSLALFPVSIRVTATAVATNVGIALLGSSAPYVSAWLVTTTGSPLSPAVYLCAAFAAALLAVALGLRGGRLSEVDRA